MATNNTKEEIQYTREYGGYYNYKYIGTYPEGTTLEEVKEKIGWNNYFGGVVHSFGDGKFKITKYTD